MNSEIYPLTPEICPLRLERTDFRPERTDFRPERADFRPEKADSKPERADYRSERAWGGQTKGRNDERKSPCVPFGAAAQKAAMKLNLRGQISGLRGQI